MEESDAVQSVDDIFAELEKAQKKEGTFDKLDPLKQANDLLEKAVDFKENKQSTMEFLEVLRSTGLLESSDKTP